MIALNLLPINYPFNDTLNLLELLGILIVWFPFILLSLWYYNRIPKSNVSTNKLNNPIYQTTDVLLQSKSDDIDFVVAKNSTSIWVKILVYILIVIVIATPLYQLFGLEPYL